MFCVLFSLFFLPRLYFNLLKLDLTKINTKSGDAIWTLANNGLDFLDSRTEFWRQQKPIYARKTSYVPNTDQDASKNPMNYIIKKLEIIDNCKFSLIRKF